MRDLELIEAVAKQLGGMDVRDYALWGTRWVSPKSVEGWVKVKERIEEGNMSVYNREWVAHSEPVPPWLTSLDAAQEVVKTLDDVQMSRWLGHLIRTVFPQLSDDDDMKLQTVNAMLMRDVINATARQRIEAFVMVVGMGGKG